MAGHGGGQSTALGAPDAPCRHARHQHHRLGVGGQGQRFLGALVDQAAHVFAQGVGRFLQRLRHGGVITPAIKHAHGLRALARKDKCEVLHCQSEKIDKTGSSAYA